MLVAETPVGQTVDVTVERDGKEVTLKVTVEEMAEGELTSHMEQAEQTLGITVWPLPQAFRQGIS